jgi:hypothetical protein
MKEHLTKEIDERKHQAIGRFLVDSGLKPHPSICTSAARIGHVNCMASDGTMTDQQPLVV